MHDKKLKIGTEVSQLQTSNLLWFERNQAEDQKDTAKNQQCEIITSLRIANKMPLLADKPYSRIN